MLAENFSARVLDNHPTSTNSKPSYFSNFRKGTLIEWINVLLLKERNLELRYDNLLIFRPTRID